ncbi:MAG TPA: hypothetical protein VIJ55_08765 [Acetobacteraceae bacterium]
MPDAPFLDLNTEASVISVQAVPGAVFLRLKRDHSDGSARRMFVELTIAEALVLRQELDYVIGIARATE